MPKFLSLNDALLTYVEGLAPPETPAETRCRAETAAMGEISGMQIGRDQGAFMALLTKLTGAKRCLEVGVFTGYSALRVAMALPADGIIDACDVSEEYTAKAKTYWAEAGIAQKIRLHIAPATETLEGLVKQGHAGTYDFAFIDADKPSYPGYYELCLTLLRPGGLIAIDNALWSGRVADPNTDNESAKILRALNAVIAADARVDASMLTVGDGVMLARKR
jgi:predicted O-methyltransferase YrrM